VNSIIIDKNNLSEIEFANVIQSLKDVDVLYVLPTYFRQSKQLLKKHNIKIGSLADYPLSQSTKGKVAFEIGRLFFEGVEDILLPLPFSYLKDFQQMQEYVKIMNPIAYGRGKVSFILPVRKLKELEKISLARNLSKIGMTSIVLQCEAFDEALHTLDIFKMDGPRFLEIRIQLENIEDFQREILLAQGAHSVITTYNENYDIL
jgi:hypothetical protein